MQTLTPVPPAPTETYPGAAAALQRLDATRASLSLELAALPVPAQTMLDAATAAERELEIASLLQRLDAYWTPARRETFRTAMKQALADEVTVMIHERDLQPAHAACLPDSNEAATSTALAVHLLLNDDEQVELTGALVLVRDQDQTLLMLPGVGVSGFNTLKQMRESLAQGLNSPLRRVLFNTLEQPHQDRLRQIDSEPDLYLEPFTAADVVLPSVSGDPFAHAVESLLRKQRADVRHACSASAGEPRERERLIRQAIAMRGLWGPGAMLDLREQTFAERRERQSLPDWVKFASPDDLTAYVQRLQHYDATRAAVLSVLGPAASPERFAEAHLRTRLADDLGHALDPQAITVGTRRTLPVTGEAYTTTRSLVELALYGLHPDDLIPGSDFLSHTTISLDDQAFEPVQATLTPAYLAQLVDELDLRARFGDYQRTAYQNPDHQQLMRVLTRARITAQAYAAKMQGHIQPDDFALIEAANSPLTAPDAAPVIQQITLHNRHALGKLLVFAKRSTQGALQRLVLVAMDAPSPQRFKAFDNPTQLQHELIGWFASDAMRAYLLGQVDVASRPLLNQLLVALKLKPYPNADFVRLSDLSSYDAGLQYLVEEHVAVALSEQARHTPDWYLQASREQRQQLVALEDAAAGAMRNYEEKPHTRAQTFEKYVHQRASQKIAQLLNVPPGSVDPDTITIYSERETLNYTDMLLHGYDDSLGLSRTGADTHAKFSGPAGVDLTLLTPERVSGSVRGQWLADDYIALVKSTLLDSSAEGYAYRRQTSVLITQLQMQAAALRSLLKGHITAVQYGWLHESIDHAHRNDNGVRERFPLYPLQIHVDKPFIGTELSGIDQLVIPDTRLTHVETVQGCIAVLPTRIRQAALLYTPQAPDGIEFRLFARFVDSLQTPGMIDYYTQRCRIKSRKTLALFLADMQRGNASKAPFLPKESISDFADTCYNRPLLRRLRDADETTTSRKEMLTRLVWTTVELIAAVVTLPFPTASFAVGALLSLHDSVRALQALREGETEAAGAYILTSLLNSLGAAGDIHSGIKGLGGTLRRIAADGQPGTPPASTPLQRSTSLPRYEDLFPVQLQDEAFLVSKPDAHGHAPVFRRIEGSSQDVNATGQFALYQRDGGWQPLGRSPSLGSGAQSGLRSELSVQLSLRDVPPINSGHAQGVRMVNGQSYIELSGRTYQVHYDAQLRCWQIVDPANPFAFFGRQPVRLDEHGQWQLVERPGLRGGMDEAGRYRPLKEDEAELVASHPTGRYELPPTMQKYLHIILNREPYDPSGYGLESYFETYFGGMRETHTALRETLYRDADAFFSQPAAVSRPRLPTLTPPVKLETWFQNIFTHSDGLVLSEVPKSVASKRLLIMNMPLLAEQRVEVIYIEHLFTDRHLPKLAQYRAMGNKSRAGSHEIKYHFREINNGALDNLTTEYDYYHLVKTAHRHGIEIRPFSSSVSYPLLGHPVAIAAGDSAAGEKMSKFFGHTLISSDVAANPSRRWIALLDHRLATTHGELPGIAELQGVTCAHIQDIAGGRATRITSGPAGIAETGVHSDYLISFSNPLILPPASSLLPSSQVDDALFKALADNEAVLAGERWAGEYGFRWDDIGGWQRIEPQDWTANHPATALQQSLADSAYDTPISDRPLMHTLANFQSKGLDQEYFILDPAMGKVRSEFFTRRRKLQSDASVIVPTALPPRPGLPPAQLPPRPTLPVVQPQTSLPDFLTTLYQHTDGVVIGETHSSIASKKLIMDNLPLLKRQNVRTLYMEHLLTDLHQADLDRFFETGQMSKGLLHDLKKLDRGHFTDPDKVYTFEQLLIKTQQHGLEIRALDCTASYYLKGLLNKVDTSRQQMMNYFASRTIGKHQQVMGAHKWIALVGNSHSSTFASLVPGIAELQGGISVRVIDVLPGKSRGVVRDPGEFLPTGITRETAEVKSDYRVELEVSNRVITVRPPKPIPLDEKLARPGMFLIEQGEGDVHVVVHRSRAFQINRTPVLVNEQGKLYVDRPSWAPVHLTPYDDMDALISALKSINLTRVG
ncbi:membrane-targeted effector domain-containing toxin [Pseudomonas sp. v388]|uniref:membrane-targeted effector domain-containing toxin n=1 Tax=Pseudomonas sp. v388 TaxID=2479849 RepID=UPI000F78B51B|nr:membrane-targeted effector domain-containing toxin [Pseudomonas sp. v388]RRV09436.1 membrane-targeted effector domain-containing toxin [Pseudomonas sp. v388]